MHYVRRKKNGIYYGKEGIMGKKSKMSSCPASKSPNDDAMEFDMVQLGASMVSGSLGRGGLVAAASLPVMGTIFGSFAMGARGGAFSMGLSGPLYGGTGPSPCSGILGPSLLSLLCGRWLAIRARA